uniref:HSF-type DNA-binding domain-containing protein n=1 Tax=Apteryx owenii TaxID=8824 RepID=A0A8B9PBI5_APTOW
MKPGGGGGAAVPHFLSKVWALVEDPQTNEFICWSADGQSFNVLDEESFAKKILPKHFKHNNMASFVRQLNSYGFHKVIQYESGSAKQERYGSGKYQHPCFKKGQEELLSKIKRKVSNLSVCLQASFQAHSDLKGFMCPGAHQFFFPTILVSIIKGITSP